MSVISWNLLLLVKILLVFSYMFCRHILDHKLFLLLIKKKKEKKKEKGKSWEAIQDKKVAGHPPLPPIKLQPSNIKKYIFFLIYKITKKKKKKKNSSTTSRNIGIINCLI